MGGETTPAGLFPLDPAHDLEVTRKIWLLGLETGDSGIADVYEERAKLIVEHLKTVTSEQVALSNIDK